MFVASKLLLNRSECICCAHSSVLLVTPLDSLSLARNHNVYAMAPTPSFMERAEALPSLCWEGQRCKCDLLCQIGCAHPTCGVQPEVPEYTISLIRLAHCSTCTNFMSTVLLISPACGAGLWLHGDTGTKCRTACCTCWRYIGSMGTATHLCKADSSGYRADASGDQGHRLAHQRAILPAAKLCCDHKLRVASS